MIVAVVGAGALGTLVAASLAGVCDVRLLVRDEATARAIAAAGGVRLAGDPPRAVTVSHEAGVAAAAGLVIVAVKSFATVAALLPLRDVLRPGVPVLSLQNGIDAAEQIGRALGSGTRVALGPTTEAATATAPGLARRAARGTTHVGWADASAPSPPHDIADLFERCGLHAVAVAPVAPFVWGKLIVNAAINPVTALARVPNGEILERPELRARAASLAREAAAVARAAGIALPFSDPVAAAEGVARATATNRSSMLRDFESGRPTEIDAISGAIARHAAALGIDVPQTRRVLDEVRAGAKA